jgi:hypothetical protein
VLDGVQVLYSYGDAPMTDACVYAGGVTFDQTGEGSVADGTDVLVNEVSTVGIYIRIVGHNGATVRETEQRAEAVGDAIGGILRKESTMVGPSAYTDIAGGTGDYQTTDDGPIVILAYRVTTSAYV